MSFSGFLLSLAVAPSEQACSTVRSYYTVNGAPWRYPATSNVWCEDNLPVYGNVREIVTGLSSMFIELYYCSVNISICCS